MDDAEAIMTEQQYTCPKCFKNYTRFTIQEHYGCGVEPLEVVKIEENPVVSAAPEETILPTETIEPVAYGEPTETAPTVETVQPEVIPTVTVEQVREALKPEPKKRGPKPKSK
jgi:hypothetical protein